MRGQCASQEDRSANSYSGTSSLTRAKKPALNAVSAKLSQMAKKGEPGHRIEGIPAHNPPKPVAADNLFLGLRS
jgi:hypothetical protein